MMPMEGRISGSLIFQNWRQAGDAVAFGGLDHFLGDRQQRGVDQHHRDADELPDRNQAERRQRVLLLAEPGREQALQPDDVEKDAAPRPTIGDRISFQAKPTMTKDRMVGTKMAVR
jgi:hypothetical protein